MTLLSTRPPQLWEPSREHRQDSVPVAAAGALHDLIERQGERPTTGSPLPTLWHWLAFLPQARQADLAADGHPRTGMFLPPAHGRARMHACGHVNLRGSLRVGRGLSRDSVVAEIVSKRGRSGELTFVTVRHEIEARHPRGEAGLEEGQSLVYRDRGYRDVVRANLSGDVTPGDDGWTWGRHFAIDSTLLFRFSALIYNAHRIHYDRDYAVHTEGYPGLVVHGPLQAILLADAVERLHPDRSIASLRFRALAPAFDDYSLNLRTRTTVDDHGDERVVAAAFSGRRHTMSVEASLRPKGSPATSHD